MLFLSVLKPVVSCSAIAAIEIEAEQLQLGLTTRTSRVAYQKKKRLVRQKTLLVESSEYGRVKVFCFREADRTCHAWGVRIAAEQAALRLVQGSTSREAPGSVWWPAPQTSGLESLPALVVADLKPRGSANRDISVHNGGQSTQNTRSGKGFNRKGPWSCCLLCTVTSNYWR